MVIQDAAATPTDTVPAPEGDGVALERRPRTLIYARVSRPVQAEAGISLVAQVARCRQYAAVHGWEVAGEFADVMGGARDDRPNYQALLAEVSSLRAKGDEVRVVVAALDRLGRRLLEALRCRRELAALDVPVHSVAEGGEVPDVVANILAAVAHEEIQQIGRRIRAVQQHAVGQGWFLGGHRAWGYLWRPATAEERAASAPRSVIDLDPITSPYVREMFARAADGQNCRELERWIKTLPVEAKGGSDMTDDGVRHALRSPLYVARRFRGDGDVLSRPSTRWPALIDDDTWMRVQQRLAKSLSRRASGRYLLTSLLRCHRCGGSAGGTVRPAPYPPIYQCDKHKSCGTSLGRTGDLDSQVLKQVQSLLGALLPTNPQEQTRLREVWSAVLEPGPTDARRTLKLTAAVQRGQRRLASAGLLLDSGDLDQGAYDLIAQSVQGDLYAARSGLTAIRHAAPGRGLPTSEQLEDRIRAWDALFRDGETARQRHALATLIERVRVERVGRGKRTIKIDWTTLGRRLRTTRRRVRSAATGAGL